MWIEILDRLDSEIIKISNRYRKLNAKENIRHEGFNSGDLRRLQALVFIKTGMRRSLKELHHDVLANNL